MPGVFGDLRGQPANDRVRRARRVPIRARRHRPVALHRVTVRHSVTVRFRVTVWCRSWTGSTSGRRRVLRRRVLRLSLSRWVPAARRPDGVGRDPGRRWLASPRVVIQRSDILDGDRCTTKLHHGETSVRIRIALDRRWPFQSPPQQGGHGLAERLPGIARERHRDAMQIFRQVDGGTHRLSLCRAHLDVRDVHQPRIGYEDGRAGPPTNCPTPRRAWSADSCFPCMLVCMRTTLQLDDELIVQAKISAARTGRTLSQVIEDALRQALATRAEPTRRRAPVPTSPGCPLPGVNLDDNAGLLDLMDGSR